MVKKTITALALLLILLAGSMPAAQAKRRSFPEVLRFTQTVQKEPLGVNAFVRRLYPETANKTVNREMKALIDAMVKKGKPRVPKRDAYLDVGANVYRTGSQWMSFLTVGRIVSAKKQRYVDFDARVYDMKTGAQLKMTDLFAANSKAWNILAREVRRQLNAYFQGTQADAKRLNALCARANLEKAAFTLSPAKMTLHYRANTLYKGKTTLMHVDVYYRQIRQHMTEKGRKITDNSSYRLIALTFDDGPARNRSLKVMDNLRQYGANATFFLVGTNLQNNDDVVCREHDAGHTVASHNYYHTYSNQTRENVAKWRAAWDKRVNALIGRRAGIMRAPGGLSSYFVKANCGLPLIHWSVVSGDAPSGGTPAGQILSHLLDNARDGAVILMHDAHPKSPIYTETFLSSLDRWGFQCVTVEELFSYYGIPLKPNHVYKSCEKQAREP